MALTIKLTPGAVVTPADLWTVALLNALANPTIELEGSIGATSIADNAVTLTKLIDGILTADAPGRAKMADGYVNTAKVLDGFLSADATGRLKMADGFLTYAKLAADAKTTGAPAVGAHRTLTANTNSGTPGTKVDVSAVDLVVKDAGNVPACLAGTNTLTGIDITASGANGLDTGAAANNTWYYIWVIYNGTTVAGLLSTSSTAPTMPGGYTHKALVGAVRRDNSGAFVKFAQNGREVSVVEQQVFTNASGGAAYTNQSVATFVPPIAKVAMGNMGSTNTSNNGGISVAGDTNGVGAVTLVGNVTGQTLNSFAMACGWRVVMTTAQNIAWVVSANGVGNNWWRITVSGYVLQ